MGFNNFISNFWWKGKKGNFLIYAPSVNQSTKLKYCWISLGSKSFQYFNHLLESFIILSFTVDVSVEELCDTLLVHELRSRN